MFPLVVAAWTGFAICSIWYFTRAKEYVPLSSEEIYILWTLHKNEANCNSEKIYQIKHGNAVVGFRCDCGYEYYSQKPIAQKPVKARVENA